VTSPPYWGLRDYGTAEWEGGDVDCDHKDSLQTRGNIPGTKQATNNNGEGGASYRNDCGKCGAKRIDAQLGLEKTPEEYVAKMVLVMREVRRVLRDDGTLWLNLGDSYAGGGQTGRNDNGRPEKGRGWAEYDITRTKIDRRDGLKPKDLVGIPWRVAFALQADGWYLRSDIIWAKPNPMPESVTDRCTKAHEYVFLLTKSAKYFYDAEAIREKGICTAEQVIRQVKINSRNPEHRDGEGGIARALGSLSSKHNEPYSDGNRNKRSVWTITTQPYPEAHFATFPEELPKICILAGTSAKGCCAKCGAPWERILSERDADIKAAPSDYTRAFTKGPLVNVGHGVGIGVGGGHKRQQWLDEHPRKTIGWQPTCECCSLADMYKDGTWTRCTVLDPFAGSGTTGAVALELGRKAILIELNPKYIELIEQRCEVTMGLQLT
jgi:DNA modification methylase